MSFLCKLGFHTLVSIGYKEVTNPKLGPFDPRTDKERTYSRQMVVCVACGREQEYVVYYYA